MNRRGNHWNEYGFVWNNGNSYAGNSADIQFSFTLNAELLPTIKAQRLSLDYFKL